jgi:1,4-alpha-glucan branching enzyme
MLIHALRKPSVPPQHIILEENQVQGEAITLPDEHNSSKDHQKLQKLQKKNHLTTSMHQDMYTTNEEVTMDDPLTSEGLLATIMNGSQTC